MRLLATWLTLTYLLVACTDTTAFTRFLRRRNSRLGRLTGTQTHTSTHYSSYRQLEVQSSSDSESEMSSRGGGGGRGGGGRGEYYRNKYGGGGRGGRGGGGDGRGGGGRGGRGRGSASTSGSDSQQQGGGSKGGSYDDLMQLLAQIDGKQYPAYHSLTTAENCGWKHQSFTLQIGRTQSDPFAAPTRCRVILPITVSHLPATLFSNKVRRIATGDFLWRQLYRNCRAMGADKTLAANNSGGGGGWSGPKGGDLNVMEPVQHVMEQSAVQVYADGTVVAQITLNLPARGRSVLAEEARQIFGTVLPRMIQDSLVFESLAAAMLTQHVDSVEDQLWLQDQLDDAGLVAFVNNGAILPRVSGAADNDLPMDADSAIPFQSPPNLEVSFTLPTTGTTVTGMGVRKGVTLICGGGFHGKSTLLQTLQLGVYSKIPGDGREFCVTSANAVKIRAEDGRCVKSVDISPFINNLPFGKDTKCFSTLDASGSTSQATNIVESIEMGADTLLVDEDTCATNFMIRDNKMARLVATEKEPITPFVRVVRSIYESRGISTVLVIGGAGDYFDVADHVLLMDCYKCEDATERAKQIVAECDKSSGSGPSSEVLPFGAIRPRYPTTKEFSPSGKVKVYRRGIISYGETELDLTGLEQIVSTSQTNAISAALQSLASSEIAPGTPLYDALQALDNTIDHGGLDVLAPGQFNGAMVRPRLLEIAGAVNRLRQAGSIKQLTGTPNDAAPKVERFAVGTSRTTADVGQKGRVWV